LKWIAERFPVPNIKPGRPVGARGEGPRPHRVGAQGSELEFVVRSGMWGELYPAERSILVALLAFRDLETGLSQLSYAALSRYAGVHSPATIAKSLKRFARLHAIELHPGARIGITRTCSSYRVTLEDPKFVEHCNNVYRAARETVANERAHRKELRSQREQQSRSRRKGHHLAAVPSKQVTEAGGYAPPDPAFITVSPERENKLTCEGLNLSSVDEVNLNKSLHALKRKISALREPNGSELLARAAAQKAKLQEYLIAKGISTSDQAGQL
jgi:hypothetical protein